MEEDFEEISPYHGETRWYRRGLHFYVAHRTCGSSIYFRCHIRGCPAKWTLRDGVPGAVNGDHTHEPTSWVRNRNSLFQTLKRRASSEATPLNMIYEEEAARYPDAAPHILFENVVSSMRTWRRAVVPRIPTSLREYGAALAEHPSYSNMLLATVFVGGALAVILAMPDFVSCLQACDTISVDGTFLTVPAGLTSVAQILTIHAVIAGHFFHPVIVLMENRQRPLYEAVFTRIWQAAGNPRPRYVVTDYELALQGALQSVTNVTVSGCLFHFFQALFRRARQHGILPVLRRDSPGYHLVRLYCALAYLPADRIALGLAEVPSIAAERGLPFNQDYHDYFVAQWMVRVGPERISVYQRPHRTSNVAESFHASLRRGLGANPNVWRFTEVAQQKMAVSAARLQRLRGGGQVRRNRERSYVQNNLLISNERALTRGVITLRDFVNATAQQLEVLEIVAAEDVPEVAAEIVLDEEHLFAPVAPLQPPPPMPPAPAMRPPAPAAPAPPPFPPVPAALAPPLFPPAPAAPAPAMRPPAPAAPAPALFPPVPAAPAPIFPPAPAAPAPPLFPLVPRVPLQPDAAAEPALCRICWESIPTLALIPCGHVLCAECFNSMQQAQQQDFNEESCPFCRTPIVRSLRIFM